MLIYIMNKTPFKQYSPYCSHSNRKSASKSKIVRPCQLMEKIIKQTPKIHEKDHKSTKKKTRPTTANGKETTKKQQYFMEKIKKVKKNLKEESPYPTPMLTPIISQHPEDKMSFQILSKQSTEKVNQIKTFLQESTKKLNHAKKQSDQLIIGEVEEGNIRLLQKLQEIQKKTQLDAEEYNGKISQIVRENQRIKTENLKQIKHLQTELKLEREERKILKDKVASYSNQIQLLESKLRAKEANVEISHNSSIKNYEQQMYKLRLTIKDMELRIRNYEEQKKFIKKNSVEVLNFLYEELQLPPKLNILVQELKPSKKK